jgi:hypothetical protein
MYVAYLPRKPLQVLVLGSGARSSDMGALVKEQYHGDFRRLYGTCVGHLNPEGNRLAAEIISQCAEREKLVDN